MIIQNDNSEEKYMGDFSRELVRELVEKNQ